MREISQFTRGKLWRVWFSSWAGGGGQRSFVTRYARQSYTFIANRAFNRLKTDQSSDVRWSAT